LLYDWCRGGYKLGDGDMIEAVSLDIASRGTVITKSIVISRQILIKSESPPTEKC
jgi:hypothetical protein